MRSEEHIVVAPDTRTDAAALEMVGIHKSFPGVHALRGVDFRLDRGEVRGLVGENGAGKSTLMNILGGVIQPDRGSIQIGGVSTTIDSPTRAEKLGVSFIHQELSIFENLDVAENIFIHDLPHRSGFLDRRSLYTEAKKILGQVGLSQINPKQAVGRLKMGQRQLVEIAHCLTQDPKILILDEPTSSLTRGEIKKLFEIVDSLRSEGVSVVFISHRLDEISDICDSITVMRDGRKIDTKRISDVSRSEIVSLMIGREMTNMYPHEAKQPGKPLIQVEGLTREGVFKDINFTLHEREIIGLYGLMGSGRTEIVRAIFGLDRYDSGTIRVKGEPVSITSPRVAIAHQIALITENRREEGLDIVHSVQSNLSLASLDALRRSGDFLDRTAERRLAKKNIDDYNIKTSSPNKVVKYLSGGNQQKVVIAKWCNTSPRILFLDEPTRGIDVGAKKEVFSLLDSLIQDDVGIFLISSELPEVIGMSDRILVIRGGQIVAELHGEEMTEENALSFAMGAR